VAAIRDLAEELEVPMGDVVKVLMKLGVMKSATEELTAEEVDFVRAEQGGGESPPRQV
jgi:Translation initiation factor IF-2, N-terminal region